MGHSVIPKKKEKVKHIFELMDNNPSEELFIDLFIKNYPKDWENIKRTYYSEERKSKGKSHPMPEPYKYMSNMYKNAYKELINIDSQNK